MRKLHSRCSCIFQGPHALPLYTTQVKVEPAGPFYEEHTLTRRLRGIGEIVKVQPFRYSHSELHARFRHGEGRPNLVPFVHYDSNEDQSRLSRRRWVQFGCNRCNTLWKL